MEFEFAICHGFFYLTKNFGFVVLLIFVFSISEYLLLVPVLMVIDRVFFGVCGCLGTPPVFFISHILLGIKKK